MIEAIGVVVPAHNEQELIAQCAAALEVARSQVAAEVRTHIVLALDACTDHTRVLAERSLQLPYECIEVDYQNVGRTRAAGAARVLERFADLSPERIWLANTDADSRVSPSWLRDQLELARAGIDAIAGTVCVDDWTGYTQRFIDAFVEFYERHGLGDEHWHVHGANLGVRGSAYRAVGGFAALATGEDHALWNALRRTDLCTLSTRTLQVTTSGRRAARAPQGFAHFLADFQAL